MIFFAAAPLELLQLFSEAFDWIIYSFNIIDFTVAIFEHCSVIE